MEHFNTRPVDGNIIHIDGIPDAVRLISIDTKRAERLAHLALHKSDLQFAHDCLRAIAGREEDIIRASLWRSAIIYYIKCFDSTSRRGKLDAKKIYIGENLAIQSYEYFSHIRNKHVVHDENSVSQVAPGAAVNDGSKSYKIEKILVLNITVDTLTQEDYDKLFLLIKKALDWVLCEFDKLANLLTADLEKESYESLAKRPVVTQTAASRADVAKRRKGP